MSCCYPTKKARPVAETYIRTKVMKHDLSLVPIQVFRVFPACSLGSLAFGTIIEALADSVNLYDLLESRDLPQGASVQFSLN